MIHKTVTLTQFEFIEPISYIISVRIFEDENYVPSYKVSLIMDVVIGKQQEEMQILLDTGIFTGSLEESVYKAIMHGFHLFGILAEPVVHIVDTDGNLDTNKTLFDIVGDIDDQFE